MSEKEKSIAGNELRRQYEQGSSIRELASKHDYSIGFVRNLLLQHDTVLRPKGGRSRSREAGSERG